MTATAYFRNGTATRVFLYHAVVNQVPSRLGWRERKYWMTAFKFREHIARVRGWDHLVLPLDRTWARRARAICLALPKLLFPTPVSGRAIEGGKAQ